MSNYKFSNEELKKIKKSFGLILEDISEIWKVSEVRSVSIGIPGEFGESIFNKLYLEIDDQSIYIKSNEITIFGGTYLHVASRNKKGQFIPKKINPDLILKVIDNYDTIKMDLKGKIVSSSSNKKSAFENLEAINRRYDKEASIEIDVPTQNQQQLKVTRENGKTIGTLDFGDRTIRVITNGSIVLVNKDEEELERIVAKRK